MHHPQTGLEIQPRAWAAPESCLNQEGKSKTASHGPNGGFGESGCIYHHKQAIFKEEKSRDVPLPGHSREGGGGDRCRKVRMGGRGVGEVSLRGGGENVSREGRGDEWRN